MQSEHNQFNVNSIKIFLSSIKNKIRAGFAYFHNDSCNVPEGLKPCWISKIFVYPISFLKLTVWKQVKSNMKTIKK